MGESAPSHNAKAKPTDILTNGVVFTILVIVIVVLSFITLIILATSVGNHKSGADTDPYPQLCSHPQCLRDAAITIDYMNMSVDPCQDFYTFACGGFAKSVPFRSDDDIMRIVQDDVINKVFNTLEEDKPDDKKSAEYKAKTFYSACRDDYWTTKYGGKLIASTMNSYGGWYPTHTFNVVGQFIFGKAVAAAHVDYGASPFFEIEVAEDDFSTDAGHPAQKYVIQLHTPYLGLDDWGQYLRNSSEEIEEYKAYIKQIIEMIREDSGSVPDAAEVEQGVEDIVFMETNIAKILTNKTVRLGNYVTLLTLNNTYGGLFDFISLFQHFFKDANIQGNTVIHLHEEDYIKQLVAFMKNTTVRQQNTYIMWKIVARMLYDMGTKYFHAARTWEAKKYDKDFALETSRDRCKRLSVESFGRELSHMFITRYFDPDSNAEVKDQGQRILDALISRISNYDWMDSETKTNATTKLSNARLKFGYPDWIANATDMDEYYKSVTIDDTAHFMNVLVMIKFRNHKLSLLLNEPIIDRNNWPDYIIETEIDVDQTEDSVYATAGVLQPPIWNINTPSYMNYGSLGRWIGASLIQLIDYKGYLYDKDGVLGLWYDEKSMKGYDDAHMCVNDLLANMTDFAYYDSYDVMEEVAAAKLSYEAYKKYIKDKSKDTQLLPGLQDLTQEQGLFVAFSQSYCKATSRRSENELTPADRLKIVLSQLREFQNAFKCGSSSPYASTKKCPGF